MDNIKTLILVITLITTFTSESFADQCRKLPKTVRVVSSNTLCGGNPAVFLSGAWKNSFSAAFRWENENNGGELEDRSPFALDNPSASSSPYKAQRRLRQAKRDVLCYGNFVRNSRFPIPVQLTIKRSVAPVLDRFCVNFTR
jgi:hypothetical protein